MFYARAERFVGAFHVYIDRMEMSFVGSRFLFVRDKARYKVESLTI